MDIKKRSENSKVIECNVFSNRGSIAESINNTPVPVNMNSEYIVHQLSRWYGVAYFCSITLKTLYQTFTVQLFLHVYKLPLRWFYIGQGILGAWNAVDDSLMAWVASKLHRYLPEV